MRREPDGARIGCEIVQAQRVCIDDQRAEDAPAARQVADPLVRLLVDARGEEPLEVAPRGVDHAQRGVAGRGQLGRRLQDALEHSVEGELGSDRDPRVDQTSPAGLHAVDYRRIVGIGIRPHGECVLSPTRDKVGGGTLRVSSNPGGEP
jgi:hypothetical protein